ncbi:MAG: thermonuclease family protein [Gammaproteobacteria bacterium]|jgi:endonuclease YncB( thermonuclease family)
MNLPETIVDKLMSRISYDALLAAPIAIGKVVLSVGSKKLFFKPLILCLVALTALTTSPANAREISSYAFVNDDGTLRIKRKTFHLYGIYIPKTSQNCRTNQIPPDCGSRAAIALEFKIKGFVRCEIIEENADNSLVGWCRVNASRFDEGEDLSAYLLERGWAVALPDAPFEYQAMEKIARSRGLGVWGIQIDRPILRID